MPSPGLDRSKLRQLTSKIVLGTRLSSNESVQTQKMKESISHIRKRVVDFREADMNRDDELTFDEWLQMLPQQTQTSHSLEELRSWFRLLDTDDGGTVTWDEYFVWALREASLRSGSGMTKVFERYDSARSGRLDRHEFARACQDLGMADQADSLFAHLASGKSATVDYMNLVRGMHMGGKVGKHAKEMRNFMLAVLLDEQQAPPIDTTGWTFTAVDADSFRNSLKNLLAMKRATLSQIFRVVDEDGSYTLSEEEFIGMAIERLGFSGDIDVLESVYDQINQDGDAHATFDELSAWMDGRLTLSASKQLAAESLRLARKAELSGANVDPSVLNVTPWDMQKLVKALNGMVVEDGGDIRGMVKAWDKSKDGKLSKKEFLSSIRESLFGLDQSLKYDVSYWRQKLGLPVTRKEGKDQARAMEERRKAQLFWEMKILPSAVDAFHAIDISADGQISTAELTAWLSSWDELMKKKSVLAECAMLNAHVPHFYDYPRFLAFHEENASTAHRTTHTTRRRLSYDPCHSA